MSAKNQLLSSLSLNSQNNQDRELHSKVQSNDKSNLPNGHQYIAKESKQIRNDNASISQLNNQLNNQNNQSNQQNNQSYQQNNQNNQSNHQNNQQNNQLNNQEKQNPLNESSNSSINNYKSTNGHDSLSEASFSDDKSVVDDKSSNLLSDLFPNITFSLKEVFRLSVRFTKGKCVLSNDLPFCSTFINCIHFCEQKMKIRHFILLTMTVISSTL